jgi:hypothetical protein
VEVQAPTPGQLRAAQARGPIEIEGAPAPGSGGWAILVTLYEVGWGHPETSSTMFWPLVDTSDSSTKHWFIAAAAFGLAIRIVPKGIP